MRPPRVIWVVDSIILGEPWSSIEGAKEPWKTWDGIDAIPYVRRTKSALKADPLVKELIAEAIRNEATK